MRTLVMCLVMSSAIFAQDSPISAFNKRGYGQIKIWVLGAAEKMPEENYSFKPTADIRSFGQLVGHVADAQYLFCAPVLGEKNPGLNIEKSKTSKADLIAALKASFAYCDKAYDSATDAAGVQTVKLFGGDAPKTGVLGVNISHSAEHYGNMVTYLRLKNIVPPSSEAPVAPPQKK
jgi:uncharacterized damage-inducible protein DinB